MKQRSLRILSWLLVAVLALSLAGCAAESKNDQPQSEALQQEAAPDGEEEQEPQEPQEEPEEEASQAEAAAQPASGSTPSPAMWEVTDPATGNAIYLLGSIHAAEEGMTMGREVLDIFEGCDALAVEVDVVAFMESPAKAMELAGHTVYLDGSSITDEIDEDLIRRVLDVMEAEGLDLGVTEEMALMFRPYTFISLLSELGVQKAGLSAEDGVDVQFLQMARELEMEILEIESMEDQLEMFNSFSPEVVTYLLEEALLVEQAGEGVRALYTAWETGDLEFLAASAHYDEATPEEEAILEEYNKALLDDRNDGMTDTAEAYLQQGKKVFYVVGVLHMVGDDGIVSQLEERGYTVTLL